MCIRDSTHRVASFRVHYSKEASLGETLTIMRNKDEDGKYIFKTVKPSGETNIEAEIGITAL